MGRLKLAAQKPYCLHNGHVTHAELPNCASEGGGDAPIALLQNGYRFFCCCRMNASEKLCQERVHLRSFSNLFSVPGSHSPRSLGGIVISVTGNGS